MEGLQLPGQRQPDPSQSQYADTPVVCRSRQRHMALFRPASIADKGITRQQVPVTGQHQHQCGGGNLVAQHPGGVGDQYAALARKANIDGVIADPIVADQLQSGQRIHPGARHAVMAVCQNMGNRMPFLRQKRRHVIDPVSIMQGE